MNFKTLALGVLLTTLFFSCQDDMEKSNTENSESDTTETLQESESERLKTEDLSAVK